MKPFFLIGALLLTLLAGPAHAQTQQTPSQFCQGGACTYVPLEPLYGLPDCYGPNCTSIGKTSGGAFGDLITGGFKLLIGAGAVIAVVMIVLGALTYMFSDIAGNKTKSLNRIRGAMWAIVLLVSSYLILYTINPDLVTLNFVPTVSNNFNTGPNSSSNPTSNAPGAVTPTQTQGPYTPPTQEQINQCHSLGGYYTFTNGNSASCVGAASI